MKTALICLALAIVAVLARWAHKRAGPSPQKHSNAAGVTGHDKGAVVGSGSEGQGIG